MIGSGWKRLFSRETSRGKEEKRSVRGSSQVFYRGTQLSDAKTRAAIAQRKRFRRDNESSIKRRAFRQRLQRTLLLFVGLALIVLAGTRLFVKGVVFVDNSQQIPLSLKDEIANSVSGYTTGFRAFKPSFNAEDLSLYLSSIHSEVGSVDATTRFYSQKVFISLDLRSPWAQYQNETGSLYALIDTDGTAYSLSNTPYTTEVIGDSSIRLIDASGLAAEKGSPVLSKSSAEFIENILMASQQQVEIEAIRITKDPREFDLQISGESYVIKITTARPVQAMIDDLKKGTDLLVIKGVTPKEYIDIRTPDKVFYK